MDRKQEETERPDLVKKAALHVKRILGYVQEFHADGNIWELLIDSEKCCQFFKILSSEGGAEPGTVHTYIVTLNWLYEDVIDGYHPKPMWPDKMEEVRRNYNFDPLCKMACYTILKLSQKCTLIR